MGRLSPCALSAEPRLRASIDIAQNMLPTLSSANRVGMLSMACMDAGKSPLLTPMYITIARTSTMNPA